MSCAGRTPRSHETEVEHSRPKATEAPGNIGYSVEKNQTKTLYREHFIYYLVKVAFTIIILERFNKMLCTVIFKQHKIANKVYTKTLE